MIYLIFLVVFLSSYIASTNFSRWIGLIPILVGLFTNSILAGLLTLVGIVVLYDPMRRRFKVTPTDNTLKGYFSGKNGLYDIWDYRIVLIVELFALIVLTSETWLTLIPA